MNKNPQHPFCILPLVRLHRLCCSFLVKDCSFRGRVMMLRRRGTLSRGIVHHFTSHHAPSASMQRCCLFVLSRHERLKSSHILKDTCFIQPNSIAGKARGLLGKVKTAPASQPQTQYRRRFSLFPGNQIGTLATIVVILPIAYWSIFSSPLPSSSNAVSPVSAQSSVASSGSEQSDLPPLSTLDRYLSFAIVNR